jgi:hypothetical protein
MAVDPHGACEPQSEPKALSRGCDFENLLDRMGPRELRILLGLVQGITKIEHGRGVSAAEAAAEQVLDILTRGGGQA